MPKADSREGNKQLVKTLYEECINTGNFSLLPRLISKSYVGPRGEKGPSGFESTVLALRRGFPDIKFTLEDLVAEGDRITVRWKWQGSHRGTYRGFPASQNQVTNEAIAIYQVENGKMVRSWIQTNQVGFLQQIGALPEGFGAVPGPRTGSEA